MMAEINDWARIAKNAAWRLTEIQSPSWASNCLPVKILSSAAEKKSPAFRRFGIAKSAKKYPASETPRLFQNSRRWFCRCMEPIRAATKLTQKIEQAQAHNQMAWVRVE